MMSMSAAVAVHGPGTGVPVLTRATLPAVPLMLKPLLLTMFAAGRALPLAPPDASEIRKYSPGPIVPPIGCRPVNAPVFVAGEYCTLQPDMFTGDAVGLKSSMKSLVNVAPELPPPPYSWLMTTCVGVAPAERTVMFTAW